MGFEIAPGDSPEDWKFDGEDWVKPDEDGVPWVWDGEEYGIKDHETGRTMVERDDGIYLKDSASGKLVASENPKTGEWQYFDDPIDSSKPQQSGGGFHDDGGSASFQASDSGKMLQPPELNRSNSSIRRGGGGSSMSLESHQNTTVDHQRSARSDRQESRQLSRSSSRQATSSGRVENSSGSSRGQPGEDVEQFIRRFWCRDDNSVEIRGFRRHPQCLNYNIAMVEHLRQIQYICKRILRANYQAGGIVTSADQVLCAIAVTITDLFDPASAESSHTQEDSTADKALKNSLAKLLQSNDLQIFEPMRNRAMCLLKNRLQCCLQQ